MKARKHGESTEIKAAFLPEKTRGLFPTEDHS